MVGWSVATIKGKNIRTKVGFGSNRQELDKGSSKMTIEQDSDKILIGTGGYLRSPDIKEHIEKYVSPKNVQYVAVIEANNTTDSGNGTVYKFNEEGLKEIDRIEGHEGAVGHDVSIKIEDKYEFYSPSCYEP